MRNGKRAKIDDYLIGGKDQNNDDVDEEKNDKKRTRDEHNDNEDQELGSAKKVKNSNSANISDDLTDNNSNGTENLKETNDVPSEKLTENNQSIDFTKNQNILKSILFLLVI